MGIEDDAGEASEEGCGDDDDVDEVREIELASGVESTERFERFGARRREVADIGERSGPLERAGVERLLFGLVSASVFARRPW